MPMRRTDPDCVLLSDFCEVPGRARARVTSVIDVSLEFLSISDRNRDTAQA